MAHSTANIKLDPGPSSRKIKIKKSFRGFFLARVGVEREPETLMLLLLQDAITQRLVLSINGLVIFFDGDSL
jgi:hypothetical protein